MRSWRAEHNLADTILYRLLKYVLTLHMLVVFQPASCRGVGAEHFGGRCHHMPRRRCPNGHMTVCTALCVGLPFSDILGVCSCIDATCGVLSWLFQLGALFLLNNPHLSLQGC